MAKQYTVNLSPRQRWWLLFAIKHIVKPQNREADRALASVWETFGLDTMQDEIDAEPSRFVNSWSKETAPYPCGSVDLNTLLGYLDLPSPSAEISIARVAISDELLRAKEGRAMAAVPEDATTP